MKDTEEAMSCLCVPSPQSKRMTSGPMRRAMATVLRFVVGTLPPVPRKVISMRTLTP